MKIRESYGIPQQMEESIQVPSVPKKEIQPINGSTTIKKEEVFDPIIEESKDESASKINKENEEKATNKENKENISNDNNEDNTLDKEKRDDKSNNEKEEKASNQETTEKTSKEDIVEIPCNKNEDDIAIKNNEENLEISKEPHKNEGSFNEYKNQFEDFLPIYTSPDLLISPKNESPLIAAQEQENITPLPQAHIQSNLSSKRASLKIDPQTIDSGTLS
ncbi:hypothetical protein PIROE2DRAFT_56941 [Piromyces sp. E2]|nr:hypothetical protein PIROE2DRAFT_56941 [Piromyces sp. E2]|eukprot:OUM70267.1 hypothetical protein PIROE2DRAFT_56941 [Piromyces sp. E2]